MSTIELKNKIIEQMEHSNDFILKQISDLLDKYDREIIASDASGLPLTILEYNDRVEEGLADLKYGRITPHEELLKEIEVWKNEL
jgi:predicted transcriptional regulator